MIPTLLLISGLKNVAMMTTVVVQMMTVNPVDALEKLQWLESQHTDLSLFHNSS